MRLKCSSKMAAVDPKTKTTYATSDWAQYHQGRPTYPPSLTDIIYTYRRQHANAGWERLVDIGAGSGVAATNFLSDFKIAHISDPSPSNEEQARAYLSEWTQRHGVNPALEYSQSTGEEAYKHTGDQAADLAICATAAHFMDPDGLVASIAKLLRPGGTLAVFSYWMPHFPGRSQHFHDVFGQTFNKTILRHLHTDDEASFARLSKVVARRMAGKGVLDSLPIPEELFEDPVRVYINAGDETPYRAIFRQFAAKDEKPGGIERVESQDRVVRYQTGESPEAEGWAFDAGKEWISVHFNTFRKIDEEEAREAFAEWNKVFDEECPGGTTRVVWPAYLVLATRK